MDDRITAYFKNGVLYKIRPMNFKKLYDDRHRAYEARYIISDRVKYDLLDYESVKSIVIPKYAQDAPIGSTGYLEYVLKKHVPTGDARLDLEILLKYTILLKHSYWVYDDKEYYRLPKKLYELGKFEKGDEALEKIKKYKPQLPENPLKRGNLKDMIEKNRKTYRNDLIEIQASYTRCEKCAIYAGRIYSVNGEDDRFPKCPEWLVKRGYICDNGCGSPIFQLIYSPNYTKIRGYVDRCGCVESVEYEPISYSNRPFIDMRNDAEIERYYKLQAEREDRMIKEKYYMQNYRNFCYKRINDPNNTPKSFSAYMRKLKQQGKYF